MKIISKHTIYTVALVGLFGVNPVLASDNPMETEAVAPAPVPAAMEEVNKPIFEAADAVALMNFTKMIMQLTAQINEQGVKGTEAKKALVDLLLKQDGAVNQSLDLLNTIAQKIDQSLQAIKTAPDSGCGKCIAGYHKIVKPVNSGINQVIKMLPVVEKYTDLFIELEAEDLGADQYFQRLLEAGVLTDLNKLLKSTLSYNQAEAPKRVARVQKINNKKANLAAKKAQKPVQPLVKAAENK